MKRKHDEVNDTEFERERLLARIRAGDATCFREASEEMKADHEVALAAVMSNGLNLELVSTKLQDDDEIVPAAYSQNILALKFASRGQQDFAIRNDSWKLEFASDELKLDKDLVLYAARVPPSFKFADYSLRNDFDFVARLISHHYDERFFRYVGDDIMKTIHAVWVKHDTFPETQDFLRESQQIRNAFMEFLCCVKSESAAAVENPVTKVNLDRETSKKLHRHIAEYAGVPLGQDLEPVRQVKCLMPIMEAWFPSRWNNDLYFDLKIFCRRDLWSDDENYDYDYF